MQPAERSLEFIRRLVAFDTVSRHSNLQLIDWVRNHLDGFGIDSHLICDDTGTKANLFATIGPADRPGYVLSGHTDVVPVDGQQWSSEPFRLTEAGGRLVGRGSSDMKSFIAVALAAVPDFIAARPRVPIHFALSYDEELGCRGVPRMIDFMKANVARPKLCIIGEPTEMKVVVAHKGNKRFRCVVHGRSCHSAFTDRGVNAVEAACELVAKLKSIARRKIREGPFDSAFDPAYTTVHTGVIAGGTAMNIVPDECHFDFEFRHVPGDDPERLLDELRGYARDVIEPEMKRIDAATGVEFQFRSQLAGMAIDADDERVRFAVSLSERSDLGKISIGTEGGVFQAAGMPSLVCGPGSIDQAHKADEWIAPEQIAACERFMKRLAARVAGDNQSVA